MLRLDRSEIVLAENRDDEEFDVSEKDERTSVCARYNP